MSEALPASGRTSVSTTATAMHYGELSRRAHHERIARHLEQQGQAHRIVCPPEYYVVAGIYECTRLVPMADSAIDLLLEALGIV